MSQDELVYKSVPDQGISLTVHCWACDDDPTDCEICDGLGVIGVSEIRRDCIVDEKK